MAGTTGSSKRHSPVQGAQRKMRKRATTDHKLPRETPVEKLSAKKLSPAQRRAVENVTVGRSQGDDLALKKPGRQGRERPVEPQRPPMANESGRSDLMRRGGKKHGISE